MSSVETPCDVILASMASSMTSSSSMAAGHIQQARMMTCSVSSSGRDLVDNSVPDTASNHSNHTVLLAAASAVELQLSGLDDLCPVCGDRVSGYHYGLQTCESCKGWCQINTCINMVVSI